MPNNTSLGASLAGLVLVAGCCGGAVLLRANYHNHVATCTVEDKDRGYSGHGSSNYRIYTKECGVLGNYDQWLVGKTASADIQGQLQVGHTYRLRIVGWRLPLLSAFPNVVSVESEVGR